MTRRDLLLGSLAVTLRQEKIEEAVRLLQSKTASGEVSAAVLHVQSNGTVVQRAFGQARTPEAVFLLASITKPMTVTAVMMLADRKQLSIDDPVDKFIPEFRGGERNRVLLRHLLTHTSGLPDMLPENTELRQRHAPLPEFVQAACRTPLLFSPGTQVRYQSMGILLAAEVVERITRRPLPDFLRTQLFQPLGMRHTSLGLGGRALAGTMQSQVEGRTDWDWNSPYWRNLASPWGGAHATAADVSRFLHAFVQPNPAVLKPATAAAMITNQNTQLKKPWGLGWALQDAQFGKDSSRRTFGHSGSTGTLCWLDPEKKLSFVLLTTKPAEFSQATLLQPVSNLIAAAT